MLVSRPEKALIRGLCGAVLGGVVGYFVFFWIVRQGFYALVIPGTLLGLGAGLGARRGCRTLQIVCACLGLLLGLFIEWRYAPFAADESLAYFVTHLHLLKPMTLLMVALGAFFSYRLASGQRY